MKIKMLRDSTVQGERIEAGTEVTFSQSICELLIRKGRAELVKTPTKKGKE